MSKAVKIILISVAVLVIVGYGAIKYFSKPLPEGVTGNDADKLAMAMMQSLNKDAWDTTHYVSWIFKGGHRYTWNKQQHMVNVQWDEHEVLLNPSAMTGTVKEHISDSEKDKLVKKSWDYFNNDSFWLCAPFKIFDEGTERSIVKTEDGRDGLKVTYKSGGTTPGDSYVWILDKDNKPTSVQMWVSVIPVDGVEFTWENYTTLASGAMVAQDHWLDKKMNVQLTEVR